MRTILGLLIVTAVRTRTYAAAIMPTSSIQHDQLITGDRKPDVSPALDRSRRPGH